MCVSFRVAAVALRQCEVLCTVFIIARFEAFFSVCHEFILQPTMTYEHYFR